MSEFLEFARRVAQPSTLVEWNDRMKQQIAWRWTQIARDLQALCDGGTLRDEMTLPEIVETLTRGPSDV